MAEISVLLDGQPVRTKQGVVGFCSIVLVEGERRVLVDVGHVGRRTALQAALEERRLRPSEIDCVVVTHAHWDHSQNLDLFPDAEILIHPLERRYAGRPHRNDWATPGWSGAMIEFQKSITEVEEGYEIEPGVRVLYTPGHSPGSICVAVEGKQGLSVVTGDVLHFSSVALSKVNPIVFWSEAEASASIERILTMADMIYPGHDRPFRIVDGEVVYASPMRLSIVGVGPDTPGVEFDLNPAPRFVMQGIEEQSLDALADG